jgi:putative nucleotidyltransferase with HDIG domain
MPNSALSQNPSSTDRYRAMIRAASALFTAESEAELAAHLETWAETIFPKAEWRLQPLDPDQPRSSDLPEEDPEAIARSLAAKTLPDSGEPAGDRSVHWVDPATALRSSSATRGTAALPEALAVISLAQDTDLPRTALLVYPDAAPTRSEREAVDAFAELSRDAGAACSPPAPSEESLPDPTGGLIEVVNTIASRLELPEVIRVVAEQTSRLLDADRSSVWLYDDPEEEIYTLVAQELGTEEIRMPADRGVAGHVLQTGIPLNLEDAYDHPAFNPSYDEETSYRTKSMLCTPLRDRQGDTLGVFQVINKLDEDRFTAEDEALLETLAGSASVAIENALLYEEQQKQFESFIQVLATTIDSRDPTTGKHTVMVTGLAVLIAKEMDLAPDTVEKIRVAGILHDVGKIVLPDEVLLKQGELTDSEYEVIQSHATNTIRILERIHFHRNLDDVPEIAGAHHERLDGDGYPEGRFANDLTLPMRILAVADVFHALIQDRPYKDSFSIEEALEECRRISGSVPTPPDDERAHLDPRAVEALVQNIEREGTEHFRERVFDRSGFEEQNVFAPELNLPD